MLPCAWQALWGCEACPAFWGLVAVWLSLRAVSLLSINIAKVTGKQGGPNKLENIMLFNLRRDLAVQVLSLLETLVSPESDWLWIVWHLDISTFSVTRTGQVSIKDGKGKTYQRWFSLLWKTSPLWREVSRGRHLRRRESLATSTVSWSGNKRCFNPAKSS